MSSRVTRLLAVVALMSSVALTLPANRVAVEAHAGSSTLTGISSRVAGGFSTVRIEATDPVAYVTSHPDDLTVLVDLRNVRAAAASGQVSSALAPIGGVTVESSTDADGTPLARVRISLTRAAGHHVRSSRNVIFVEVDRKLSTPSTGSGSPVSNLQPSTRMAADHAPSGQGGTDVPASLLGQQQPAPPPVPSAQTPSPQPVPASEAPDPAQAQPSPTEPRRFTGHPVSLDFQGADLRAVLRTFAEISGLNVVLDPAIPGCAGASGSGCVDLALKDVPWDQALDVILKANKLGYTVDGTIIRIAPLASLRELAAEQALAGELHVLTRTLSYAKANDLIPIITRSTLSQRGEVQVDERTNTLVVRDLQDRLQAVEQLVVTLDRPERQVEIEARIVRVRRDYSRELGILWGLNGRMSPDLGNTTGLKFPNSGAVSGRTGGTQGPGDTSTAVNLPTENAARGAIGVALGSINGAFQLDITLQALEDQGKLRLLSSPRVSTQNNVEAEITQGTQIPLQTQANNTITVSFKDAALTLKVTPQITASDTVILRINLEKSQADFSRQINGIPPIDTQRAITNVLLANGETTVIGGIFESQEVTGQASVPLFSRIPLLGWLFKNSQQSEFQDELMIFITPRIQKS
jgi:type IV pilus secretin PilQ/predicted competence protein